MDPRELAAELRRRLGTDAVLSSPEELSGYEHGWRYGVGKALAAALPSTSEQVAEVLSLCARGGVRVQPMGANTGLVGASNPDPSGEQLVLSLERLDRIVEIDPVDRVAVVEAGLTLSRLNEALRPQGLCFPVDLGADPQIGGMIATNTGGTRLLRYGDVRHNLLGIEVALADGSLVSRLSRLRKDNTGLDLRQIFTGTSGSFGVITRAVLELAPLPRQRLSLLVAADGGEALLALLERLERELGELLSAFEVISGEALAITVRHGARVKDPFPGRRPPFAALVELSTTLDPELLDLTDKGLPALSDLVERVPGLDPDSVILEQQNAFWHLRHMITESVKQEGRVLAFDLSVPRPRLAAFSAEIRRRLRREAPFALVCDYGHWGDGGTHLNLVWDPADPAVSDLVPGSERWRTLQDLVYSVCVEEFGGSFSAEHGVGPHNQRIYDRYTPVELRRLCGALKRHLDPGGRLGTVRLEEEPL